MKPQEAIEIMKIAIAEVEWNYPMDYAAAFETAIEALEKQEPYEPKLKKNSGHYWGKCKCTDHIVYNLDKSRYCENCGQLLKGRDEDE